jgi:hypothetical protein
MTANQSRLLGLAILVASVAVVTHLLRGAGTSDVAADNRPATEIVGRTAIEDADSTRLRARFDAGAYVAHRKQLADGEEIVEIVIPEGLSEELDTRCIVYRNAGQPIPSMACSGIRFGQPAPRS